MAELAIAAAISIGIGVAESALTPKPKLPRLDKGRADDIRIMSSDEGTFIPRVKGWARLAPNIIWNTTIQELAQKQTVGGGGKGLFGGGQTQEETTFSYVTSLGCAIAAGPVMNGLKRVWADNEVVLNLSGDAGGYYEGEDSANTRTGTTSVNSYDEASGKQELTLAPGASVEFNSVLSYGAKTRPITIYFRTDAVDAFEFYVNGALVTSSTFANSGNTSYHTKTINAALNDGLNTVKIKNTSSTKNIGIDRIFCFPGFADTNHVTGVISAGDFAVVAPDPDDPSPYFDDPPRIDPGGPGFGGGAGMGTLTGLGGAQFAFYLGTEDQPQDPTMVSEDGADQVPAYRGVFICVISNLLLKEARLPNITFEFDEGTHDLAVAVTDYYKEVGARAAELEMGQLSGIHFIGHVVDSLRPLSETLEPLQQWYNFDLLPIDGQIKAVLRGGSIVETISESSLAVYEEGEEPPAGPLMIDYLDPALLPREIHISYLDVAKDYHNATEVAARAVGLNENPETQNFPIVSESDEAVQVGLRLLYQKYLERPVQFTTGPEFHHLAPTDPVTLSLSNISHRVRLTGKQAPPGGGLIRWKGVTEDVGVYTQTLAPGLTGYEPPVVDYPANSVFVIIDAPLVRAEDAGDGTSPVIILAMCKRGTTRAWRGGVAFKEEITDEWRRETNFTVNSTIGVMRSPLADCADPNLVDSANSFTVDFWNEVTFESFEIDDLIKKANVNLFWIGVNGGVGEYVQAAVCTPVTPLAGFTAAYTFSLLLRGRFLTESATSAHGADEFFVLMDSTLKPRRCDLKELQAMRRWVGASVGQGINEALTVSEIDFTLRGRSLQPPAIASAKGTRDSAGNLLIEPETRSRITAGLRSNQGGAINEEREEYRAQILSAGSPTLSNGKTRILPFSPGRSMAAALIADSSSSPDNFTGVNVNTFSISGIDQNFSARAIQKIEATGNFVEATLQSDGNAGAVLALYDNDNQTKRYSIYVLGGLLGIYVEINDGGGIKVGDYAPSTPVRVRITVSGAEVRFYLNYSGSGTPALYVAEVAPVFPLIPKAQLLSGSPGGDASVSQMILTTYPFPKTIYSAAQQRTDFSLSESDPLPAAIEMDLWKESPIVTAGQKKRVTL